MFGWRISCFAKETSLSRLLSPERARLPKIYLSNRKVFTNKTQILWQKGDAWISKTLPDSSAVVGATFHIRTPANWISSFWVLIVPMSRASRWKQVQRRALLQFATGMATPSFVDGTPLWVCPECFHRENELTMMINHWTYDQDPKIIQNPFLFLIAR